LGFLEKKKKKKKGGANGSFVGVGLFSPRIETSRKEKKGKKGKKPRPKGLGGKEKGK